MHFVECPRCNQLVLSMDMVNDEFGGYVCDWCHAELPSKRELIA